MVSLKLADDAKPQKNYRRIGSAWKSKFGDGGLMCVIGNKMRERDEKGVDLCGPDGKPVYKETIDSLTLQAGDQFYIRALPEQGSDKAPGFAVLVEV